MICHKMPRGDVLLSPREAAELVGCSAATVRRWVREGAVPAVKVGPGRAAPVRIPLTELIRRLKATGHRDESEQSEREDG